MHGPGASKSGVTNPYIVQFMRDKTNNMEERKLDRPETVSKYAGISNVIDIHNHMRQLELALEEKWENKNPHFRLFTTLTGMALADAWRLDAHHKLIEYTLTIQYC
jgi:acetate kinase